VPGISLRRKLVTTFTAFAVLGVLVALVTGYTITQWTRSEATLQRHYARSLLLQEVQAVAFRAFKEAPDAVFGNDPDAREEFEELIVPALRRFEQWAALADDDPERAEVAQVRASFDTIVQDARTIFDLVDAGETAEAARQLEDVLEDQDFEPFEVVTGLAIENDRDKRELLRGQAEQSRRAATVLLAVALLGVLFLMLLVVAYLGRDLFGPLRRLREGLAALARGDTTVRLDDRRRDELGEIGQAYNALAERLSVRAGGPR
jgi:two-component system, OmpR family, sensor kinase